VTDELSILGALTAGDDHVTAEALFTSHGWTRCGVGDWAVALRSPSGDLAARISPFDPVATYTVRLFREAADTGQVPVLHAHRELEGGAVLTVMEHLLPAAPDRAAWFFQALAESVPEVTDLGDVVARVLADAHDELPWCDRLDSNPANVMRRADGGLVLTDPFFADGETLYGSLITDASVVARIIPPAQRRHMFDLPLAESGPWDPVGRERMRASLAAADAHLSWAP
jgi:hypothetical protein